MKLFPIVLLLFLIACADDPPSQVKVIPPADTLGTFRSDTALLNTPPLKFSTGTLQGTWCDRPMTIGLPASHPPGFVICNDSAAYWYGTSTTGRYYRSEELDLRILDDGRVWFDVELYAKGMALRFCGTIYGDTLKGSALTWPVTMGERNPGPPAQPWRFVRVP